MDASEVVQLEQQPVPEARALTLGQRFEKAVMSAGGVENLPANVKIVSGIPRPPSQADAVMPFRTPATPLGGLVPVTQTTAGSVLVIQPGTFTNAAAPVTEGTLKPTLNVGTLTPKTLPLQTIAAWLDISRQALEDIPGIRDYIDSMLAFDVNRALENQMLNGNGTSPNLLGFLTVIPAAGAAGGTTNLDKVFWGVKEVLKNSGYIADGVILSPDDAFSMMTGTGGGPPAMALPAGTMGVLSEFQFAVSAAMPAGTFLVGAFGRASRLFQQEEFTIRLSRSHNDYFVKNLVVLLGETVVALAIYQPNAFVKSTF